MKMISLLFLSGLIFISCATDSIKRNTVDGLVYDEENSPVCNVSLYCCEKKIAETDLYGHFCFDAAVLSGNDAVNFRKDGYENLELFLSLSDYPSLLYITMQKTESLIEKAAKSIKEGNYLEAENILTELKKTDRTPEDKKRIAVLECAILYRKGKINECIETASYYYNIFSDPLFLKFKEAF